MGTLLPVWNFFSVPTIDPLRAAALICDEPRTTVSRELLPPRTLLPILVTVSQPSSIFAFFLFFLWECVRVSVSVLDWGVEWVRLETGIDKGCVL